MARKVSTFATSVTWSSAYSRSASGNRPNRRLSPSRVPPSRRRSQALVLSTATTSGIRSGQRPASATVSGTSYSCTGPSRLRNRSPSCVGTRRTVDQGRPWMTSIAAVVSTPTWASHCSTHISGGARARAHVRAGSLPGSGRRTFPADTERVSDVALDAEPRAERRGRPADRLDVAAEGVALMLRPHHVLARGRHVGEPTTAWTGNHVPVLLPSFRDGR